MLLFQIKSPAGQVLHAKQIFPYPLKYYLWLFTASKFLFSLSKKWSLQVRYLLTFKKLNIQILKVSLILKLIIQITLTLILGTFLNSVMSTHLISQLTSDLLMKETEILHQILDHSKVASRCLEYSSAQLVKCTYTKLKGFLVCYNMFLGVLKVVRNSICFRQQYDFSLNVFPMWLILI